MTGEELHYDLNHGAIRAATFLSKREKRSTLQFSVSVYNQE